MKSSRFFAIWLAPMLGGLTSFLPCAAHAAAPVIDGVNPGTYLSTSTGTIVTATGNGFAVPVSRSFTQMTGSGGHTCAIGADDQKAYCWGNNASGQLGNGRFIPSPVPVAVDTSGVLSGKTIKHISAGYYQTCVVASDDRAYCWGSNDSGQLGNNSASDYSAVPVAVDISGVLTGKAILQIEAGAFHTCVIASDGRAYCWGANDFNQLGDGSTNDSLVPVAVDTSGVLAGKTIKQIATRGFHTCAIASDNRAYCWGEGSKGPLGNGSTARTSVPVAVDTSGALAGKTIRQISANYNHTCAIASDDQAYCWGNNDYGQLGNDSVAYPDACSGTACSMVPVAVDTSGVLAGKTIRQIANGSAHTCVIASDAKVYCWGANQVGELGAITAPDACNAWLGETCSTVPIAVDTSGVLGGKTIQRIARSGSRTCVIDSADQAYCWGGNGSGQLGNGSRTDSFAPVSVIGWLPPTATVAGVPATDLVVWADTLLTFTAPARPTGTYPLTIANGSDAASLPNALTYGSAAPLAIAAVSPNDNLAGQETITVRGSGFLRQGPTSFTQVANGDDHACAIASVDRQAYCWGNNDHGQLGNGSFAGNPTAVDTSGVLAGKIIQQIAAGEAHTCAIASDGRAYCWGINHLGQLGNGSSASSSVPIAVDTSGVLAGKTLRQLTVGRDHTCVIASDNRAYCWGYNSYGQLGSEGGTCSGNIGCSLVPVAVDTSGVLAGLTIQSVAPGRDHTCAIASNGRAYCWGYNLHGELGNNSYVNSRAPVAVDTTGALAGKTVQQIAVGSSHSCAIASDNRAYCWGDNPYDELGNNSRSRSPTPVAVDTSGALAGKAVQQLAAGLSHTCAVASDGLEYCWGDNYYGQVGSGPSGSHPVAVDMSGVLAGKIIRQTTAGNANTCAIASDDQIYCWGNNDKHQLGNNTSIAPGPCFASTCSSIPVAVVNGLLPTATVGGAPATDVVVVNDTTLTFTAPWMANGTYDLVIDYGAEMTSLSGALTYFVIDPIFNNGFEQP